MNEQDSKDDRTIGRQWIDIWELIRTNEEKICYCYGENAIGNEGNDIWDNIKMMVGYDYGL